MSKISHNLIRAAGGLVWRRRGGQLKVLLIHRPRYGDWALPKGKLKNGERWEDAARREVAEETGLAVQLDDFAGLLYYVVGEQPKVVLFWNMHASGPASHAITSDTPDEVSEVAWLSVPEALARLSYRDEAALLQQEARRRLSSESDESDD
jgi:8-oxo-dGTP diphosphatase